MGSRSACVAFAASMVGVLALGVSPVSAGATTVEETVNDMYAQLVAPGDSAMFVNSPRDDYCTEAVVDFELAVRDWVLGGMLGDFPQFPGYEAGAITLKFKDVGEDNVRFFFSAEVPVALWDFEPGKTSDAPGFGPCTDTDGLDDATGQPLGFEPTQFAEGLGTWSGKDNDAFGVGPRSNVWGDTLVATLTGDSGTTSLRFKSRWHTQGCTDDGCHIDTYRDYWTIQTR